ncbi:hypothetical protein [Massilia niabensis]|uniref:Uncharacterized protein n=1 Tax=Massilia niabensis TaxID=544910 RepID=A0ABW0L7M2_9BURK
MWRIEFTSSEFLPTLPEECQGNPGVYGFELAFWLARMLVKQDIVTSYPLGEDWGWLIEYVSPAEAELTIGCSSMADEGDGYRGMPIQWSVFIRPHISIRQRFKGVSHNAEVRRLGDAIVATLLGAGIKITSSEAEVD